MGMYTELIFGASLKEDTPKQVINALKYMGGEIKEKPFDFPLPNGRCECLFNMASYYFAISEPLFKMWYDEIGKEWRVSSRSNIKDYNDEIKTFLEWIKPFISSGSGTKEMYAIVIYEESEEPTIYYLN